MKFARVVSQLLLMSAAVGLQACYQASPPSTPVRTVDTLVVLLADQDWVTRQTAAEALGKVGDTSRIPNILSILGDPSSQVREAAARSLGRLEPIGSEAATRLIDLLKDQSPSVRMAAAQSLAGSEGGEPAVSGILTFLSSAPVDLWPAAVSALLGRDLTGADETLLRTAVKGDTRVRQTAVAALGDQTDDRSVAMLLDRLQHDGDAGVRAEAAYRLGFHAGPTTMSALEVAADHDTSAQVRRWAQQSLSGLRR